MNRNNRALLIGMSIGDGHIRVSRQGNYPNTFRSELRIKHSWKQREYLMYKADLVKKIFSGKCNIKAETTTLSNGKTYLRYRFLKHNKYFKQIRKWLYPNGEKYISRRVLEMLNPQSIAIWFMDDGSVGANRNKKGLVSSMYTVLSTQTGMDEAVGIIDYFKDKHGVKFKPILNKGSYVLMANTAESNKFLKLIAPYIIPSMMYKLRYFNQLFPHESQIPLSV